MYLQGYAEIRACVFLDHLDVRSKMPRYATSAGVRSHILRSNICVILRAADVRESQDTEDTFKATLLPPAQEYSIRIVQHHGKRRYRAIYRDFPATTRIWACKPGVGHFCLQLIPSVVVLQAKLIVCVEVFAIQNAPGVPDTATMLCLARLIIQYFMCRLSLLYSALYENGPYYLVLYIQSVLII